MELDEVRRRRAGVIGIADARGVEHVLAEPLVGESDRRRA